MLLSIVKHRLQVCLSLTAGIEHVPHLDPVLVEGEAVGGGGVDDLEEGGGLQHLAQPPAPEQVGVNSSSEKH